MNHPFNPLEGSQVSERLVKILDDEFSIQTNVSGTPQRVTSATSAWVWFIEFIDEGLPSALHGPQVLRISEPKEKHLLVRQVNLSRALIAQGFPAPRSNWHGEIDGFPVELQQRLSGRQAIDLLGTTRGGKTLRALADLQAKLHSLSTDQFDLPHLDAISFLKDDLELRRNRVKTSESSGTLDWLQRHASSALMASDDFSVICHGDFHPLNALVAEDGSIGIVDWTDASLGDRHHDVGRTIATYWFGALVAETKLQRNALRILRPWMQNTHQRAYEESWSKKLDKNRLNWWQVAHLYRFWLLLAELADGTVASRESKTTSELPDDLMDRIVKQCQKLQKNYHGTLA